MTSNKRDWFIRVSGYGTFGFHGTEEEAEEMRRHKAKWEGAPAAKWLAKPELVSEKLAELQEWFFARGGCPRWVFTKLRQYKSAEKEAGKYVVVPAKNVKP